MPIAIGVALFISHYATRRAATTLGAIVDLLAAVPSLVFGMWGLYFLIPNTQGFQMWLSDYFGWIPLFNNTTATTAGQFGKSLLIAGIVLAIMIIPIVSAVCREVFLQVPRETMDAAWALGATKWEMIRTAVLPFGRAGIISAAMLGLGRALGETIAVALVLNSGFRINWHLTEPGGDTFASTIALKFGEAGGSPVAIAALIAAGLFLFVITLVVNTPPGSSSPAGRSSRHEPRSTVAHRRVPRPARTPPAQPSASDAGRCQAAEVGAATRPRVGRGRRWRSACGGCSAGPAGTPRSSTAAVLFVDRLHRLVVRRRGPPPGEGPVRLHPDLRVASSPRSCRWC